MKKPKLVHKRRKQLRKALKRGCPAQVARKAMTLASLDPAAPDLALAHDFLQKRR